MPCLRVGVLISTLCPIPSLEMDEIEAHWFVLPFRPGRSFLHVARLFYGTAGKVFFVRINLREQAIQGL